MTEDILGAVIVIVTALAITVLGVRYVASYATPEETDATPEETDATADGTVDGGRATTLDRWLSSYAPWLVAAIVTGLAILWSTGDLPLSFQLRVAIMVTVLVPVAVLDVRFGVVASSLLVALVVGRGLSLAVEVTEGGVSWSSLGHEVAVAAAVGAVFGFVRLTSRAGLGGGDIFLFMLFPLMLGPRLAVMAVFVAFGLAFLYSAWVLASRRGTRKDTFPLCPAILVGTVGTVLVVSLTGV